MSSKHALIGSSKAKQFGICGDCGERIHPGDNYIEIGTIAFPDKPISVWFHKHCATLLGEDLVRLWKY